MAKKRGKTARRAASRVISPVKSRSRSQPAHSNSTSNSHLSVSNRILSKLTSIETRLTSLESLSKKEFVEEEKVEHEQEAEISELKKLEALEQEIEEQVKTNPFRKITYRDFSKSAIGAFFGILGHFSFFYGVELSHDISVERATVLYLVAFLIGAIFLYMTGYKRASGNAWFMSMRLLVIYFTSLLTIIIVLFLFDFASFESSFVSVYKTVATISILAVMGAIAADLIGKDAD